MKRRVRSAPIWLFSFVDLAFLLLIALTQLVPDPSKSGGEVARLELPRIAAVEPARADTAAPPRWQLRVHPLPGSDDPTVERLPFELIEPGFTAQTDPSATPDTRARDASTARPAEGTTSVRLDAEALAARLERLRARALPRPILAPHRDARSEDLLVAVALLERAWEGDRGVTVDPLPSISAPPMAEPVPASARDAR
ncbi:MAG: hypothetical protein R3F35_22525 [Myxococcota bacterium]